MKNNAKSPIKKRLLFLIIIFSCHDSLLQGQNPFKNAADEMEAFIEKERKEKDFSHQFLSGKDFSNSDLRYANFQEAILEGTNFQNCILWYTDFRNTSLVSSNLSNASFYRATLQGSNLSQAVLDSVNFEFCNLENTIFLGNDLRSAKFTKLLPDFQRMMPGLQIGNMADLTNEAWGIKSEKYYKARLKGARFTAVNLASVDLWRADLQDAILSKTNLKNTNLEEANLRSAELYDCDFTDAKLTDAELDGLKIRNCKFGRNGVILAEKEENYEDAIRIYRFIKLGYLNAGMREEGAQFFFREMQTKRKMEGFSFQGILLSLVEYICGYGQKPLRIVNFSIMIFIVFTFIYLSIPMILKNSGFEILGERVVDKKGNVRANPIELLDSSGQPLIEKEEQKSIKSNFLTYSSEKAQFKFIKRNLLNFILCLFTSIQFILGSGSNNYRPVGYIKGIIIFERLILAFFWMFFGFYLAQLIQF